MTEQPQPPPQPQPQRLRIGEGKISGYLSIFLAVICFHFPEYFTTPEFRAVYPVDVLRWVLLACLVLAFGFALTSFLLSGKTKLGLTGVLISALAIVLGGNTVKIDDFNQSIASISLDWLLIDILVLSAIFIPIELFLPKRTEQTKFHLEWKTDLVYFAVGHLLVQFTAVVVKAPAESIFGGWGLEGIQSTVSSWPFLVQLPLAMLVADLFQYVAHRTFHANSFLWRFHAVHHSIRAVDWLAGSRLHLVDIFVTRAFSYIPLYVLGFSMPVFYAYVAIVALQAVAAHANTRIPFGPVKYVLVTPQYHHWHHSDDPELYDKNFAIHFPLIDKLFGTYHLPGDEWPETMGLGEERFPKGYPGSWPTRSGTIRRLRKWWIPAGGEDLELPWRMPLDFLLHLNLESLTCPRLSSSRSPHPTRRSTTHASLVSKVRATTSTPTASGSRRARSMARSATGYTS